MESRVMGNCHARFGAGENPEERICSLRLHIPPKGLPIAILRDGGGGYGIQAAGPVPEVPICGAKPPDGAVGQRALAALSCRQCAGGHEKGF